MEIRKKQIVPPQYNKLMCKVFHFVLNQKANSASLVSKFGEFGL